MTRRAPLSLAAAVAALAVGAPAASAEPTWTSVPTPAGIGTVNAVELQPGGLWAATSAGRILRRVGGVMVEEDNVAGAIFHDLEMRGTNGVAVGASGLVRFTTDGGDTWAPATLPLSNPPGCAAMATAPLGTVQKVTYVSDTLVYAFGDEDQIIRSTDAGATWANHNPNVAGGCKIDHFGPITGAFIVPGVAYLQDTSGGNMHVSTDDLTTSQPRFTALFGPRARIAGDPVNPSRQWGIENGSACELACWRTEDGWSSELKWFPNLVDPQGDPFDVDYADGTVLGAGSGGNVWNSIDGRAFHRADAKGALSAQEWRAVSLANASQGAVAGENGQLAVTDNANTLPPPPPVPTTTTTTNSTTGGGTTTAVARFPLPGPIANPRPRTLPQPSLPSTGAPPATIRIQGRLVIVRVSGRLGLPPGAAAAQACRGELLITVVRGRRVLTARATRLGRNCRYLKIIRIGRSRVGNVRSLRIRIRFVGNTVLRTAQKTYTVRIRR